VRITVRGFYFNDAFSDLQNRDIERTAAEVINRDRLVLLLIETIGQGRRRRFVNDSEDLQTRNTPSIFGRLALRVIEVGWNGNDRLVDFFGRCSPQPRISASEESSPIFPEANILCR